MARLCVVIYLLPVLRCGISFDDFQTNDWKSCDIVISETCSLQLTINYSEIISSGRSLKTCSDLSNHSLSQFSHNHSFPNSEWYKHNDGDFFKICAKNYFIQIPNFAPKHSWNNDTDKIRDKNYSGCPHPITFIWYRQLNIDKLEMKKYRRHVTDEQQLSKIVPLHDLLKQKAQRLRIERFKWLQNSSRCKINRVLKLRLMKCNRRRIEKNIHSNFSFIQNIVKQSSVPSFIKVRKLRSASEKNWIKLASVCKNINGGSFFLKFFSIKNFDQVMRINQINKSLLNLILIRNSKVFMNIDLGTLSNASLTNLPIHINFNSFEDSQKKNSENTLKNPYKSSAYVIHQVQIAAIAVSFVFTAMLFGILIPICMRRRACSTDSDPHTCDTYSEESAFEDDHAVALQQSDNNDLNSKLSFNNTNCKEELPQKMLTYQNNNQIPPVGQQSKINGNSKRKTQAYCCGNSSSSITSKSVSPCSKRNANTSSKNACSSSSLSPVARDPFHRVPNNPYRTEASRLTPKLLDQANFPPTIPRWPRSCRKEASAFPVESTRYHTPPNRSIITNDGNLITSVYRGQYCVQYEPSRSCSSLDEPPKYSSRCSSSVRPDNNSLQDSNITFLSVNKNYFLCNGSEPPPEYSSPPSYDSIV